MNRLVSKKEVLGLPQIGATMSSGASDGATHKAAKCAVAELPANQTSNAQKDNGKGRLMTKWQVANAAGDSVCVANISADLVREAAEGVAASLGMPVEQLLSDPSTVCQALNQRGRARLFCPAGSKQYGKALGFAFLLAVTMMTTSNGATIQKQIAASLRMRHKAAADTVQVALRALIDYQNISRSCCTVDAGAVRYFITVGADVEEAKEGLASDKRRWYDEYKRLTGRTSPRPSKATRANPLDHLFPTALATEGTLAVVLLEKAGPAPTDVHLVEAWNLPDCLHQGHKATLIDHLSAAIATLSNRSSELGGEPKDSVARSAGVEKNFRRGADKSQPPNTPETVSYSYSHGWGRPRRYERVRTLPRVPS